VAGLVEAVGVGEARVHEPELLRLLVHERHESRDGAFADVERKCGRRVVRAGDQRRADELGDAQLLPALEEDRRPAGACDGRAHADDVRGASVLERDQRRHELRDARDRARPPRALLREDEAVLAHEVPGGRVDARLAFDVARGLHGCGKRHGEKDGDEQDPANHRTRL
jgi:hypothetical protein